MAVVGQATILIEDSSGHPLPSMVVPVVGIGVPSTFYSDISGSLIITKLVTDSNGYLTIFASPGQYQVFPPGGRAFTVPIAATASRPYVTVSPTGIAAGQAQNNGADFGPDTPGTTTSGIQEALNSLPLMSMVDGGNFTVPGRQGTVRLLAGVFQTTSLITIPAGVISFRGAGASTWQYITTIASPTTDLGGTQIVGAASLASAGVVACLPDSHAYPATQLDFGDMDIRITSPGLAQTSSAPDVVDLGGFMRGTVSNLTVAEIKTGGGVGNNMFILIDMDSGASTDEAFVFNVAAIGAHTGIRFNKTHIFAANIFGGQQANTIDAFATAIYLGGNLDNNFYNLHAYFCPYGITFYPYTFANLPFNPVIIRGFHFEGVSTHYFAPAAATTGVLIIDGPIWNSPTPGNPNADINGVLSADSLLFNLASPGSNGFAVITRNELDLTGYGAGRHVTVAPAQVTAGASPYTFPLQPFDCVYILKTAGGISALTLDGTAVALTTGIPIFVPANHTLIATWATTAPVFQIVPQ